MAPRQVLVVDSRRVPRELVMGSDEDFEVRALTSVSEALTQGLQLRPDVIVLALGPPEPAECEYVRKLSTLAPTMMLIERPADEGRITTLFKAGASGYIDFEEVPVRLFAALRELLWGGVPMSRTAAQVVLRRARRSSTKAEPVRLPPLPSGTEPLPRGGAAPQQGGCVTLSERQREVLTLVARGHTYEHVAQALDVSVNTIRTHLRAIYARLGVATKVEAVVAAHELGLLEGEGERT